MKDLKGMKGIKVFSIAIAVAIAVCGARCGV